MKHFMSVLSIILFCLIFWLIVWFVSCCQGCSWQGQKHIQDPNSIRSEWWSMRFLWMSNGIECYTETPYYTSGANIKTSQTDPNAAKAVVEGVVEGIKVAK